MLVKISRKLLAEYIEENADDIVDECIVDSDLEVVQFIDGSLAVSGGVKITFTVDLDDISENWHPRLGSNQQPPR